ncbi:LuxR C-terminal-related transcriptional regulator [Novosphingobium sp. G106]|uniref:response regulator transcription factor n=1 Tax=Novosphingobium sp. G106 TaxID=2849500 RepID=UPI001C2CE52E|nr:LuxR C-terminal-related transcriptional regulator [Novosphingobium sp. G106]MBV1692275.1 LuxR C-terminal-related transcriptional regulator [Novosphingobium sp. G106]
MYDVFAIDQDVKRRASISYFLNGHGIHTEPFEMIEEFVRRWPTAGVFLLYDEGSAVSSLLQEIYSRHTWLPVVAYSENPDPARIVAAVLAGAVGYTAWPGSGDALIRAVHKAGASSAATVAAGSRQGIALSRIKNLSKREREILAGMVEGLSNRLIGENLAISPRTVELHRANLLFKIGAKHSAEAIRVAIEASLPPFGTDDRDTG